MKTNLSGGILIHSIITFLSRLAIFWACVALAVPIAIADQLVFRSDQVDEAVQGGAGNFQSFTLDHPEYLAYRQAFTYLYQRNPNLPREQAIEIFERWRARFIEQYHPGDPSPPGRPGSGAARYDYFNGACDIIAKIPGGNTIGLGFVVEIMRQASELGDFRVHRQREPIYRISSLLRQGFTIEAEREWNRRANTLRLNNPNLAGVLEHLDQDANRHAAQIIANHPEWGQTTAMQALRALINERGEIVASLEQLQDLFYNELANLRDTMDSNLTLLQELSANQNVLYEYMMNAEQQRLNQERIASEQAAYEQKIRAANASVYILSTLVGFNNPELGRQMQVVGDSTVQIADALHQFAKADALGSVILTGNVLGAVMNVVSLFGDSGPSADDQILAAIAQLQQTVLQIREEMHERFDRVDAALNEIYFTISDRFNRIDIVLGILHGDVKEIQLTLYDLQSNLYRIERKVFNFLDAGFRRDLNEAINGYLGYRTTYGTPIPWASYVFAENKFYTWAVNNALDEISSGSAGRSYTDAALYAELTSQPLENNLNYLSQFLAGKGWPAFAGARLANPRDWAIAANSWMELAAESPMFFRQISSNRIESIYQVGQNLQRAVSNITVTTTNPAPVANRALFNALFANYRAKAAVFTGQLDNRQKDFLMNLSLDTRKRPALRNLDPWGGTSQSTTYLPTNSTIPAIANQRTTRSLALPTNWGNIFPPSSLLAELLDMGRLGIDWRHIDLTNVFTGKTPFHSCCCSPGIGPIGSFTISVHAFLDGNRVSHKRIVHAPIATTTPGVNFLWPQPGASYSMGGVACSANLTWNDLIGIYWYDEHEPRTTGFTPLGLRRGMDYFVTDSQSVPGEYETNVTHTSALVANRLRELQRLVYQDILQGLSEAGGLASSATELSGAKALIESFVVLGFSQSLEFNDILTSLLFGDERIIEIDKINELCQMGITRTYDTNQNAKVDIVALLNERVNALETLVSNRLTQVQTNGAETLRLVTSTLSRLDVFRAGRNQPTPAPYIAPLGFRLTNGVPNPIFIVWGEPNLRYTVQFTTNIIQSNLTQWVDLPIPADEGTEYATTSAGRSGFHRAVLGP